MNRPCYYITDGDGIDEVAYVANPAILRKGVALEEQEPKKHKFSDTLLLQVAGPVLIPDIKIFRQDKDLGEYDVVFSKERILSLHTKQKLEGKGDKFNLDHDSEGKTVQSVILYEWIVQNSQTDQSVTKYNLDPLPEGTLFRVTQFAEDQRDFFMKEIIGKDRTGFSIEGFLGLEMSRINEKIKQEKINKMAKNRFEKIERADGGEVFIDGTVAVDSYVYYAYPSFQLINGVKAEIQSPVWDTVIELVDGTILTLDCGKIVVVEKKAATTEPIAQDAIPTETPVDKTEQDKQETEMENKNKLADTTAPDAVPAETPAQGAPDNTNADAEQEADNKAIMAIVTPLFDEVYKKIAELQTMIETGQVTDDSSSTDATQLSKSKLSSVDSLVAFMQSSRR